MSICFIIPPHILEAIAKNGTDEEKQAAQNSIDLSLQIRQQRKNFITVLAQKGKEEQVAVVEIENRLIYNDANTTTLPGTEIGKEGNPPTDPAGDEAYIGTGATYDLYKSVYSRNSIDNKGLPLISTVHYSTHYDNAFWDGQQMVYGDGDGIYFQLFTKPIDVTGHELTHGVTQYSANLTYQDQSGALNESFSDVFGSLVKQKNLGQTAEEADWLIGEGIFTSKVHGKALRSMKAPGTAYDDPIIGKDPQPGDMAHFVTTTDDNGGVHINSGIPNHAFYLAATGIGGFAWEKAGLIWYKTLTEQLKASANFSDCAYATLHTAGYLFGTGSKEEQAIENAWKQVGVL